LFVGDNSNTKSYCFSVLWPPKIGKISFIYKSIQQLACKLEINILAGYQKRHVQQAHHFDHHIMLSNISSLLFYE